MKENSTNIQPISIESEMRSSYLDYAMSVIVGRALPDVRDGLKPVHRRVLFSMYELKNDWNKPYKKSARIVGDVIGKYHPHGDSAVYETIVRLAQDFAMRYTMVDGQGNFGSIDGDRAAAMRYTEIRLTKIAHELLQDIDKETVDMEPNYDGNEQMPSVLPTLIPNLLINGSSGIAVGMATNIPPHNIKEVLNACLLILDNPEIDTYQLMEVIPAPDFPTGALLIDRAGIAQAYQTGNGAFTIRAKTEIVESDNKSQIVVHELPYQVNKAHLIEKIAELCKEGRITGISNIRDESDKDGIRIVIEIKRGEVAEVILNKLYLLSNIQKRFNFNMIALVAGKPKLLSLKEILEAFIDHRRDVVTRRSVYLLNKARKRAHILEGLSVAIVNIDKIIAIIRQSKDSETAKKRLMHEKWDASKLVKLLERAEANVTKIDISESYQLSSVQAQAILDLRLHRLTGLEYEKLCDEYCVKLAEIEDYMEIISSSDRLKECIKEEINEQLDKYADERKSELSDEVVDIQDENLIANEDRVLTVSHHGYIKAQSVEEYRTQRRGGVGKTATTTKDTDWVETLYTANTHDTLLCFSNFGKVYWLRVFEIPVASRQSRGRPMNNLLPLDKEEKITSYLPIAQFDDDISIVLVTAKGTIKKMPLKFFERKRKSGLIALQLNEGDFLVGSRLITDTEDIMLFSDNGRAVRFHSSKLRNMGRTAKGVRGMRLDVSDTVISMAIPKPDGQILTISKNGYGKRTLASDYEAKGRGIRGIISMKQSERNGIIVSATQVFAGDEIMCITDGGTLVRTSVDDISLVSRNTQGVRILKLRENESMITASRVELSDNLNEN